MNRIARRRIEEHVVRIDVLRRLRRLERRTRAASPEARHALDRRWDELPDAVKTDAQLLGGFTGCEGTPVMSTR